jgi:hypothetical protein
LSVESVTGGLYVAEWKGDEMLIDCDVCAMKNTSACDDCVVSVLLQIGPVELSDDEVAALDNLAGTGLVPKLRLVPTDRRAS